MEHLSLMNITVGNGQPERVPLACMFANHCVLSKRGDIGVAEGGGGMSGVLSELSASSLDVWRCASRMLHVLAQNISFHQ
jgi:hypothetical protein